MRFFPFLLLSERTEKERKKEKGRGRERQRKVSLTESCHWNPPAPTSKLAKITGMFRFAWELNPGLLHDFQLPNSGATLCPQLCLFMKFIMHSFFPPLLLSFLWPSKHLFYIMHQALDTQSLPISRQKETREPQVTGMWRLITDLGPGRERITQDRCELKQGVSVDLLCT